MDSTSIILRTAEGDFCPPKIDYGEISEAQLEALVQKTRDATLELEAELEKRHNATSAAPSNLIKECENKLHNCLQYLKIHGRLDARSAKSVELAVSLLPTKQTVRGARVYRDFLNDVIRHCGHGLALLCAASLGKQNIVAMNAQARTSLISHIRSKKVSLYSPDLETLAKQHNLPIGTGTELGSLAERPTKRVREDQPTAAAGHVQTEKTNEQAHARTERERDDTSVPADSNRVGEQPSVEKGKAARRIDDRLSDDNGPHRPRAGYLYLFVG
ncbi:uncharacterized protein KY384_005282 [Bacidia gigantensis]|uniref:uncharacterized protein n=1 Tax=Bacidia gigantensis TaxID=2732470 RepID=UPI001D04DF82|nr:uncharacterized protein KY384_005282 [Bacidia gigantensis]KAG8529801.1 hypothetical protein KY384_005282 [Bacidia gigantensis]